VTLLIEFTQPAERARALARLKGIEDRCWVEVAGHARVFAVADEDLERENEEKTSAVHFLRFELSPGMIASLRAAAALAAGVDHEHYRHAVHDVPASMRLALAVDFS
jgi:precorrin-3B methylase